MKSPVLQNTQLFLKDANKPVQAQASLHLARVGESGKKNVKAASALITPVISPYKMYLKCLYEYFKEDLEQTEPRKIRLPAGFMALNYQREAVAAAHKALERHNGVFLADVVGLGKTCIASLILQSLPGKKLVICPPVLKLYWRQSLMAFFVQQARVISSGKLIDLQPDKFQDYSYIIVDESHRFRNEKNRTYDSLKRLCLGKKVILISATPFNNSISDLTAQIKLFQKGKESTFPGLKNLEGFLRNIEKEMKGLDPGSATDQAKAGRLAALMREKVLKYIMIRRTRGEVLKYFADDLAKNGMRFPEIANPEALIYEFDSDLNAKFEQTIELLKKITYAAYCPLLYLTSGPTHLQTLTQSNIRAFIKSTLVKRLESSFYAFQLTVARCLKFCEQFLADIDNGLICAARYHKNEFPGDAEDRNNGFSHTDNYQTADFSPLLIQDLQKDIAILTEIISLWNNNRQDPKFETFLQTLTRHPRLQAEKALVFTESAETASYLYEKLEAALPGKALMFSSQKAKFHGQIKSSALARELIKRNFDPACPDQHEFQILITTDVLAEGINLHRAGSVINYDLPWNPTRIMQRLGRINRVGTSHANLYIFNFLPTAQADTHLGLQNNVGKKIHSFNSVLGNDAKLLFDNEIPEPHGLFQKLSSQFDDQGDNRELAHWLVIKNIRDRQPDLFAEIKQLPDAAISASHNQDYAGSTLFFCKENSQPRFILVNKSATELLFEEAMNIIAAKPHTEMAELPADFSLNPDIAKTFLARNFPARPAARHSTANHLLNAITGLKKIAAMTDSQLSYLQQLFLAIKQAAISKKAIAALAAASKKQHNTPSALLQEFEQILPPATLENLQKDWHSKQKHGSNRVVTLAQYLAPI